MITGNNKCAEAIVTGADGEVLAVISDSEIIEKEGVSVELNELA